jgi:imidazolonepropionase-like amidohydrolase
MKAIAGPLLLLFFVAVQAQPLVSSEGREIVFQGVSVVSMETEKILGNQTVVVRDGKIVSIGQGSQGKYAPDAIIIDGRGKFLIPGLAEMHAHVPPVEDLAPMKEVLMLFVSNGITTIRGMLGHPKHLELRSMIRRGEILGPNFYTTGPSFNGMSVTSPEQASDMVQKQKAAGYDFLKLHPGLSRKEFDAISSTAKAVNIPFAGHVSFGVGVWRAIDGGYSSIDHLDGFVEGLVPGIDSMSEQQTGLFGMFVADQVDRSQIPRLMKELKANGVWVVPTQSLAERWFHPDYKAEDFSKDPDAVYMSANVTEQWVSAKTNLLQNPRYDATKTRAFIELRRTLIKACQDNGVGLLLGCDAPQVFNVPGFSTHNELEYLVKAGLTPYQALRTGTVNVAKYLGNGNSGVIREGSVSDLVLLNGNPLADIRQTRNIAGVMVGTKWLSKEYIDAELKKLEKTH